MKKSTYVAKQKELQHKKLLNEVAESMSRKYAAYLKEKRESGDIHAID